MTQEQFAKYSYRHSEIMVFHQKHPEVDIEMMLVGVNFDYGTFALIPFELDVYEEEVITIPYKYVDKIRAKPKMTVRMEGKIVKVKED